MGHVVYRLITVLLVGARTKEYLTKNQREDLPEDLHEFFSFIHSMY